MLSHLLLVLLLAVLAPRAARACAAAQRLRDAPFAPGVPVVDAAGESFTITDVVADDFAVARAVANLSAAHATRLCLWTQQVLPSPPTGLQPGGSCEPSPCAWPPLPASADDVGMLMALGAEAIGRMALMDAGAFSFVGSTCGAGSGNADVACAAQPGSVWCEKGMLAQRTRWAVGCSPATPCRRRSSGARTAATPSTRRPARPSTTRPSPSGAVSKRRATGCARAWRGCVGRGSCRSGFRRARARARARGRGRARAERVHWDRCVQPRQARPCVL